MEKQLIKNIAIDIASLGGETYYVGGFVRDLIMKKDSKDIDVEIYNITPNQLKSILNKYGKVDEVGAAFGILKIHGIDIDFAMPRSERKVSEGHKGFDVSVNPFMSKKEASMRRDFTFNSILKNVVNDEIIDLWGGIDDIENGIIRHINDNTFIEDPLRVMRACQFAARFNFKIANETIELCKSIDLSSLARERFLDEFKKGLTKSDTPSVFLDNLNLIGAIDFFPELKNLIGVPQNPVHHPEGDVWTHTKMVLDEAAKIRHLASEPFHFMMAALCHDMGKAITTTTSDGKIVSNGHDKEGVQVAKEFLIRITNEKQLTNFVLDMVKNHMRPNMIVGSSDKAVRKLIVDSCNISDLLLLAEADHLGRLNASDFSDNRVWLQKKVKSLSSKNNQIKPLVSGKDLIKIGVEPGKHMGFLLKVAFDMQLDGLNKIEIINTIKNRIA